MATSESTPSPGRSIPFRPSQGYSQGYSQRTLTPEHDLRRQKKQTKIYFLHHNGLEERQIADQHKQLVEENGYTAACLAINNLSGIVEQDEQSTYATFWQELLECRTAKTPIICCVVSQVQTLSWPAATPYAQDTPLLAAVSPEGQFVGDLSLLILTSLKLSVDTTWVFDSELVKPAVDRIWLAQDREICCGTFELIAAVPQKNCQDSTMLSPPVVQMVVQTLSGTAGSYEHLKGGFLHKKYQSRGGDGLHIPSDRLRAGDWPGVLTKLQQLGIHITALQHTTVKKLQKDIDAAVFNADPNSIACTLGLKSIKMAWQKVALPGRSELSELEVKTNRVKSWTSYSTYSKRLAKWGSWGAKLKPRLFGHMVIRNSDFQELRHKHVGILQRRRRPSIE